MLSLSLMTSCKDENKSATEAEAVNTTGTSTNSSTTTSDEFCRRNADHSGRHYAYGHFNYRFPHSCGQDPFR